MLRPILYKIYTSFQRMSLRGDRHYVSSNAPTRRGRVLRKSCRVLAGKRGTVAPPCRHTLGITSSSPLDPGDPGKPGFSGKRYEPRYPEDTVRRMTDETHGGAVNPACLFQVSPWVELWQRDNVVEGVLG